MVLVRFASVTGDAVAADVDAVLFDKDGTLFDAAVLWREMTRVRLGLLAAAGAGEEGIAAVCRSIGFDPKAGAVDRNGPLACATPKEESLVAAGALYLAGHPWAKARRLAVNAYQEAEAKIDIASAARLLAGVDCALRSLAGVGVALGVVTTDGRERSRKMLAACGLDGLIGALVAAEDFTRPKPDPEPLLKACEMLRTEPGRCAYVGDSTGDMLAAAAAGFAVRAGVLTGSGDLQSLGPLSTVMMKSAASVSPCDTC